MHIHILGICGTFMGGIAALAREAGFRVTGCDANVYPPMSTQLTGLGIDLIEGYDPGQVRLSPDLFVIGNVVSRGNPLMEEILDQGLTYVSGPQWVGEHLLRGKHVLAVAGTHGKTTTASMLAWILDQSGLRPGFLIGGIPSNFGVSARSGAEHVVIEADEYDSAFFDKRSKFVHYRPTTAILNNLEFDHADIFVDLAAIETQFHHLVRTIPRRGMIVVNALEASLARVLARGCWSAVQRFGGDGEWQAGPIDVDGSFEVIHAGRPSGRVRWELTGEHNRMNALAALAAACHAGVAPSAGIAALRGFAGAKRRMEVLGIAGGVTVYDDFAHHPTAIATTLAGLRARFGAARILAILEPRSNTMKLGVMKAALPQSLAVADLVFGYGATQGSDALGWDLAEALAPLGRSAVAFSDIDALVKAVVAAARPGDHVVVMSNGGFGGVHQKLLASLASARA